MATKTFWIGSTGPFYYDDDAAPGGLAPAGVKQAGIVCEGKIYVGEAPDEDEHVLRLADAGLGDWVSGPGEGNSTNNAVARYDGSDGNVQNSGVIIDDSNNITGVGTLTASGKISTTGTAAIESAGAMTSDGNLYVGSHFSVLASTGSPDTDAYYRVDAVKVVGSQEPYIDNANDTTQLVLDSGSDQVDRADFNTKLATFHNEIEDIKYTLNQVLLRLKNHGLIASS